MTATQANVNSAAARCPDKRAALTPAPVADRVWQLYNDALACRALLDGHRAAGEVGEAAECAARGRAILRELREMEAR